MSDDPRWSRFPIFREFFLQWRKARGNGEIGSQKNRFSRDWEELLRDAGLLSALDRREAIHEVRILENAGMLQLKAVSQRPEEILRIYLPLDAEPRLRILFADELPQKVAPFDFSSVDWVPELSFLGTGRVNVFVEDLLKLNDYFRSERSHIDLNIKERSLQIFGDEKRLDALYESSLFREGRLSLQTLRCFRVAEPLGWERGPNSNGPLLVIENACTWDTYCHWNQEAALYSGIVYGGGNRFMDSVTRLRDIFTEIGGQRRVLYFGDLDPQGLRIPRAASHLAQRNDLPPVEADLSSYINLLAIGKPATCEDIRETSDADLAWISPLATAIQTLFDREKRIAQESITLEFLKSM